MTAPRVGQLAPAFRVMAQPWRRLLWDIRRRGFEHVPRTGPAILAPNHLSVIDSMLLMLSVDRPITFVGKAEYMQRWPSNWLYPALGMIPIDRSGGAAAEGALEQAAGVLDRGQLFGIYPEGTRSRDGYLHRGRTGAARLALRTGAPLIPIGIRGTDRIQPPGAPMPRVFLGCSITVGRPIDIERHRAHTPPHLQLRAITDELMFEIGRLSRQAYVDRYGSDRRSSRQMDWSGAPNANGPTTDGIGAEPTEELAAAGRKTSCDIDTTFSKGVRGSNDGGRPRPDSMSREVGRSTPVRVSR
jgi:1-acyl-sn-glycerol-3-phosphate acyltransferase